ncbi:MAG: bifunctional metallophosphatase/5'-nucleotidase [Xanthomonadaceae bacterium]|nr:bifunctional metallophosphatase/5'-nucleotidase [Xanthomonadaceae bacterium]
MRTLFCVAVLSILPSCSSQQKSYSSQSLEKVVVLGLNDFHGSLEQRTEKTIEFSGKKASTYQDGGAAVFASYVKILKKVHGSRLLVVDAGDEWQGSLDSNLERGATVVQFFNRIGVSVAAIGNHEFDFGVEPAHPQYGNDLRGAMKTRFLEANYPYVAANIYKKGTNIREEFPNTTPTKIFKIGKLKVGVIGLSTTFTPETTRYDSVSDLDFRNLRDETLDQTKLLREQGADIVIVTTHAGVTCDPAHGESIFDNKVRRKNDPNGDCKDYDELYRFLNNIPKGTVDLVVSGHTHTILHHWINGTPVIQGEAFNHYFNVVTLTYDHESKRVVPELTEIEGPVPVCDKVFKNLGHCNGKLPAPNEGRGALIPAQFHGQTITPDPEIEKFLKPLFEKTKFVKSKIIGVAARTINHSRWNESEFGNFYTDVIRAKVGADIAIMNSGGIRDSIGEGMINFDKIFRALPFDNYISRIEMTGKELDLLFRLANNGSHGVFQISGLTIKMIDLKKDAPANDLNGDGKIEYWEVNRILEIRDEKGNLLDDNKIYVVATVDYLAKGGDNLGWIMNQIPKSRIKIDAAGAPRDALVDYFKKHSPVNTKSKPLKDPRKPRIILI